MKKVFTLALALTLLLGLFPATAAGHAADFSDVPKDHWAYGYIMDMADQGLINGTGDGKFSPNEKVSAAMFITLLGRVIFPEITVAPGESWYEPYFREEDDLGWFINTGIDASNLGEPITRYNMAMLLSCAAGNYPMDAAEGDLDDFADGDSIPSRCRYAVSAVYGMGLIRGDNHGNFNGRESMSRAEAATVLFRLTDAIYTYLAQNGELVDQKAPWEQPSSSTAQPAAPSPAPSKPSPAPTTPPASAPVTPSASPVQSAFGTEGAHIPDPERGTANVLVDGTMYTWEARQQTDSFGGDNYWYLNIYPSGDRADLARKICVCCLGTGDTETFNTGDTMQDNVSLSLWEYWTIPRGAFGSGFDYDGKSTTKAVSTDFTGAEPSLVYFSSTHQDGEGNTHTLEGKVCLTIDWPDYAKIKASASGSGGSDAAGGTPSGGGAVTPGVTVPVVPTVPQKCPGCVNGACRVCGGDGWLEHYGHFNKQGTSCITCHGSGRCIICGGTGYIK